MGVWFVVQFDMGNFFSCDLQLAERSSSSSLQILVIIPLEVDRNEISLGVLHLDLADLHGSLRILELHVICQ